MRLNFQLLITILALTFVFSIVAFTPDPTIASKGDFFLSFLLYQLKFIVNNITYFGLGFAFIAFILTATGHVDKQIPILKRYLISLINTAVIVFLSIFTSYIMLLFVAILELNIMSIVININPKLLGLSDNIEAVEANLNRLAVAPQIITSEKDRHKMLLAVAVASSGRDNLFAENILPVVPSFAAIPIQEPKSSVFMLDDILIFTYINREEIEKVSPKVASLLAQSYFYNRNIKSAVDLSVVDIEEYVVERKSGLAGKLTGVNENNLQNEENIATYSARIEELEELITANQNLLDNAASISATNFKECIKTIETPLCQAQRKQFSLDIDETEIETESLTKELEDSRAALEEFEILKEVYAAQAQIVTGRDEYIKREHGLFEPENKISIPLNTQSERTITDFYTIFIHEFLHYASYVDEATTFESSFFEEGLTEYFARKILRSRLETATNLGYPLQIKIIEKMMEGIHESEFEDIYFTKDKALLATSLDRVYGEGFFDENIKYFEAMQYTSEKTQLLKIANLIMKKIGGTELTEADMQSNFAN